MKHEKPGYTAMLEAMQKVLGDRCATTEQHRFAVLGLGQTTPGEE